MNRFQTLRRAYTELVCAYLERRLCCGQYTFTALQECNDDILNAAWDMLSPQYGDSEIYHIINRAIERALKPSEA